MKLVHELKKERSGILQSCIANVICNYVVIENVPFIYKGPLLIIFMLIIITNLNMLNKKIFLAKLIN